MIITAQQQFKVKNEKLCSVEGKKQGQKCWCLNMVGNLVRTLNNIHVLYSIGTCQLSHIHSLTTVHWTLYTDTNTNTRHKRARSWFNVQTPKSLVSKHFNFGKLLYGQVRYISYKFSKFIQVHYITSLYIIISRCRLQSIHCS